MHGFVAQRLRGIGRCIAVLLLPFTLAWIALLIDVHDLVVGIWLGAPSHTKLGLIGGNSDFPAIQRHAVVDVVSDGVHFRRVLNGVRIAIRTASRHQVRDALVNLDFVILDAILGDFSLGYIRKIVAKPRPFGIRRLALYLYKPFVGAIRRLIVIPKLLAGVLPLGIDFASICHLARIGFSPSKGIVRRARTRAFVAKTLQQARMGEDRIVLFAGQADLLKLRRHLIGIFSHAESAEERGCRRVPFRITKG